MIAVPTVVFASAFQVPSPTFKQEIETVLRAAASGDCKTALPQLRMFLDVKPEDGVLLTTAAFCEARSGSTQTATDLYEKVAKLQPSAWQAWNNLGAHYLLLQRNADALAVLQKAAGLVSSEESVTRNLAEAYVRLAKRREAYQLLLTMQSPAIHDLRLSIAAELGSDAAHLINNKRWAEARDLLLAITSDLTGTASWHNLLGYSEFQLGNAEPALYHLQEALRREPNNEDYLLDLGEFLSRHSAEKPAVEVFEIAAKRLPHSPRVQYGLAVSYLLQQRREDAMKLLKDVLAQHPAFEQAYRLLGECHEHGSEWSDVAALSQRMLELNPNNAYAWYFEGRARLGNARASDGALEPAEAALRRALELDGDLVRAHFHLARVYELQGELHNAVQHLKRTVTLDGEHGQAHYVLGRLYQRLGQKELAKQELAIHSRLKATDRTEEYRTLMITSRP